jgi:hypothetical protein
MVVKDSRGRQTALVESSATPSVEFRGSGGKRRINEWLMQDSANPQVASSRLKLSLLIIVLELGACDSCFGIMTGITGLSRTKVQM